MASSKGTPLAWKGLHYKSQRTHFQLDSLQESSLNLAEGMESILQSFQEDPWQISKGRVLGDTVFPFPFSVPITCSMEAGAESTEVEGMQANSLPSTFLWFPLPSLVSAHLSSPPPAAFQQEASRQEATACLALTALAPGLSELWRTDGRRN